ncbi:MAG: aminoglycoside phosphotransferase [Alphaproteobacteria bacterium]|nr:aminoglycoside phosphotransferase [Alphaproteobacteria bacterium]
MSATPSHDERVALLAEAALPRWGLSGAPLRLLSRSENSIYLVMPPAGAERMVLRVHRTGYHTRDGIRSELAWMRALQAEAGVTTPQAIPGRDGEDIQGVTHPLVGTRDCVLFAFIEGTEPALDGDLVASFRQLGEITARTHAHSQGWRRPAYFERLIWDFEHCLGAAPNWGPWTAGPYLTPAARALLERTVATLHRQLARYGKAAHRYGLIHADFRLANLLVHNGDVRVIDFDDCGLGWFLYDAATALTLLEHRPEAETLLATWLAGYRRVRPIVADDEAQIPTLVMLRRLLVLAWLGSHADTDLARQAAPGYTYDSCALAERYLATVG